MSCKKIILAVVLILLATSMINAQVNFQQVCTLNKPVLALNYQISQLFDYNDDGYDDIIIQYFDEIQFIQYIIISDMSGTIIDSIAVDDWVFYDEYMVNDKATLIKDININLLLRAQTSYPNLKLRLSLQDCGTLAYIDSTCIFSQYYDWIFEINTVKEVICDDQVIYCIGVNEFSSSDKEDSEKSLLYIFQTENDTLYFNDSVLNCGLVISTLGNTVLTIGRYQYVTVGAWPWGYKQFYLNRVHFDSAIITEQLNTVNGAVEWTDTLSIYNHYPKNYDIITKNCLDEYPQVLQYRKLDTDNGNSVHFRAFDTSTWQGLWSRDDSEIGLGNITSSTCIQVNGEDHYVMYFRGDKLEIRDRINGNIIHHQDSVLTVCNIFRKSDGELLFFVEKLDETGYDVYSLDGPIFVSNDESPAQNDVIIEQYPNPFHSSTTFLCSSKEPIQNAEIKIYNLKGQLVREFGIRNSEFGFSAIWDGRDEFGNRVSSGLYFYQVKIGDKIIGTNKCLLLQE